MTEASAPRDGARLRGRPGWLRMRSSCSRATAASNEALNGLEGGRADRLPAGRRGRAFCPARSDCRPTRSPQRAGLPRRSRQGPHASNHARPGERTAFSRSPLGSGSTPKAVRRVDEMGRTPDGRRPGDLAFVLAVLRTLAAHGGHLDPALEVRGTRSCRVRVRRQRGAVHLREAAAVADSRRKRTSSSVSTSLHRCEFVAARCCAPRIPCSRVIRVTGPRSVCARRGIASRSSVTTRLPLHADGEGPRRRRRGGLRSRGGARFSVFS